MAQPRNRVGRPERPVLGTGPVAELARELRRIRDRAGQPPYRDLAQAALTSSTVLNDAAAGRACPTWEVVEAFVRACGEKPDSVRPLWKKANAKGRAGRREQAAARAVRTDPATLKPPPGRRGDVPAGIPAEPDPRKAATPAQYVHQLRALRAWAGQPGRKKIARLSGQRMPSSTLYSALSPSRTRLPSLDVVEAIVQACASPGTRENWIDAWRALRLRQFEQENPGPPEEDQEADVLTPEAWRATGEDRLGVGCAAVGGELAGQARPLLEVAEQLAGHPDAGGEQLAEHLGRGHAAGPGSRGPGRAAGCPAGPGDVPGSALAG